jgi:galactokinase
MGKMSNNLKVSAPGRVCLFGEHQDYLGLPVIPCAISLRISIEGKRRTDAEINIKLPDLGEKKTFSLQPEIPYVEDRDYFRSVVNILQRSNYSFSTGFDCIVRGNIPINAGMASSSALIVAWINFLTQMSDQAVKLAPIKIADYAYQAEVLEFSEPGGMMDHYSSAIGGIFFLESLPRISIEPLQTFLKSFVLGDSGEAKDTKSVLARVKNQVIEIIERMTVKYPNFSLRTSTIRELREWASEITEEQFKLLEGTLRNYQITQEARQILKHGPLDHRKIGTLLNEHQTILRDTLRISTPKIDRMVKAALEAGAYGAKINGSGGGGCMFAYAPEQPQEIADAIEKVGRRSYIVNIDTGTHPRGSKNMPSS